MKRRRNFLALVIAVPIVAGLSRAYRPYLDAGFGAAIDVTLLIFLFFGIRAIFAKFESGE